MGNIFHEVSELFTGVKQRSAERKVEQEKKWAEFRAHYAANGWLDRSFRVIIMPGEEIAALASPQSPERQAVINKYKLPSITVTTIRNSPIPNYIIAVPSEAEDPFDRNRWHLLDPAHNFSPTGY